MKSFIAALSTSALMMIGCAQSTDTPAAGTVDASAGARAHGIAGYELAFGGDSVDVGLRGEAGAEVGRITLHTQPSFFLVAELDGHVITTEPRGGLLAVTMDGADVGGFRVDGEEVRFVAAQTLAGDRPAETGLTLEDAQPYLEVITAVVGDPALQGAVDGRAGAGELLLPLYAEKFCAQMARGCDAGSSLACGGWALGGCFLT